MYKVKYIKFYFIFVDKDYWIWIFGGSDCWCLIGFLLLGSYRYYNKKNLFYKMVRNWIERKNFFIYSKKLKVVMCFCEYVYLLLNYFWDFK